MSNNYQNWLPRGFWGFGRYARFLLLSALSSAAVAQSVTLAWDPNPEPDIAGYRLKYGTSSRNYTQTVDVGTATGATVSDLAVGATYFFGVTAYNAANLESEPSNEVSFAVPRFENVNYSGLISPGTGTATHGYFTLEITPTGTASGRLVLNGEDYAWRGVFDSENRLTATIPRADGLGDLTLTLQIAPDMDAVTGGISDDLFSATIQGDRATFSAKTNETPLKGRYTVALFPNPAAPAEPQGYGFATLTVASSGAARLAGRLPDGAKFSVGAFISKDGRLPVYAALYRGGGCAFGEITFQEIPGVSDANAVLLWSKPDRPTAARFKSAFAIQLPLRAARYGYVPGAPILEGLAASAGKARLSFSEGDLPSDSIVNRPVAILPTNETVVFLPNNEQISLALKPGTGMLTGLLTPLGEPTRGFKGVFFQKGAGCAYGLFLGASQTGRVDLEPAL